MKTRLILLVPAVLFATSTSPKLLVSQISEILGAAKPDSRADRKIAQELARVEPAERITEQALATLLRRAAGPQSEEELRMLAAESEFLNPPESTLVRQTPPDAAE